MRRHSPLRIPLWVDEFQVVSPYFKDSDKELIVKSLNDQRLYRLKLGLSSEQKHERAVSRLLERQDSIDRVLMLSEGQATWKQIIQLEGFEEELIVHSDQAYSVHEFQPNRDLFEYISSAKLFPEPIAHFCFHEVIGAVSKCHESQITHNKVMLESLLFDGEFAIKLTDFSKSMINSPRNGLVAEDYKKDLFDLGVVLFSLVFGFSPLYLTRKVRKLPDAIFSQRSLPDLFWKETRKMAPWSKVSKECEETIEKLLLKKAKNATKIFKEDKWLNFPKISRTAFVSFMLQVKRKVRKNPNEWDSVHKELLQKTQGQRNSNDNLILLPSFSNKKVNSK